MAGFQPVRLAYNTHEPATGIDENLAPIIYLHGATAFKESWGDIPQVVANATRRRSYSVDARNHGDSEWNDYFNFDINADDLLHFMDVLGIRKAILVGHSMGGITAIKTALKRPERVEKIVIEDMLVRKCPKQIIHNVYLYVSIMRQAIEKAPSGTTEEEVKMFIVQFLKANMPPQMQQFAKKEDDVDSRLRYIGLRQGVDGRLVAKCNLAVLEKALANYDTLVSEPEGTFEGSACFIYGKLSPFLVGSDEHHIRKFFPRAVLSGVEDADHDVHGGKPLEFTDALLKFIL